MSGPGVSLYPAHYKRGSSMEEKRLRRFLEAIGEVAREHARCTEVRMMSGPGVLWEECRCYGLDKIKRLVTLALAGGEPPKAAR